MPKSAKPPEPDAAQYLYHKYIAGNPARELQFCEEAANAEIATAIFTMRSAAGLTQSELAKIIGTKKSAISRLEDSDYQGHSLGMLRRIGDALGYKVALSFTPVESPALKNRKSKKVPTKDSVHGPVKYQTGTHNASGRVQEKNPTDSYKKTK